MSKGLTRSQGRLGNKFGARTIYIQIRNLAVSMTGTSGVGWGTAVLGGMPTGWILIVGANIECTQLEASGSISNTFNGDISVGSAPTADATLNGAEVDVIPSTAVAAASSSVAPDR